jgi:hypothetical protein
VQKAERADELLDGVAADWLESMGQAISAALARRPSHTCALLAVTAAHLQAAVDEPHLFRLASGPHGFGRPGGVLGADDRGPLPQQHFVAAAPAPTAELAWIATHGLAMLTVDGPYRAGEAQRRLPALVGALSGA